MRPIPRGRQAFTLIEVLVVMGVILILSALTASVIVRARNAAKETGCISNLSQIGKAALLYLGSNDDYYPPFVTYARGVQPPQVPPETAKWMDALAQFGAKQIWKCPSDPGLGGPSGAATFFHSEVQGLTSYETAGALGKWEGSWSDGRLKLSSSTAPADRAYAADVWFSGGENSTGVITVHGPKSHSVCNDGHVVAEPIQQ
jgi:prepilin-type N-terminal cleavage/methylation domain-containing protein